MSISLASVSCDPSIAPPRVVLYGPQKIGKTTFGASAPNPILLPVEDGIGNLSVPHFPLLHSFDEVMQALEVLITEPHDFETVVVDSLDWLEPLVWAKACHANNWDSIEKPGFGKGYVEADKHWKQFITALDALRSTRAMAVVLLAHTEVRQFMSPETEPYDRYGIKLHKRAAGFFREWPDALLFANFSVQTVKSDAGYNKVVNRGIGTGERVMHTEERPAFYAGNRYGLPAQLPLSWQAFESALTATLAPTTATTAAA